MPTSGNQISTYINSSLPNKGTWVPAEQFIHWSSEEEKRDNSDIAAGMNFSVASSSSWSICILKWHRKNKKPPKRL